MGKSISTARRLPSLFASEMEPASGGKRTRNELGVATIVAIAWLIGIGSIGRAAQSSVATAQKVYVGVYVKQIHGISLRDSQATVDFHIWFRWTGDNLKPLESFDLVNGRIDSKQSVYESTVNGMHYASCRVVANLHKVWNVSRYPLDRHFITIEIEDNDREADKLIYLPDEENSGLSAHAEVAGWNLKPGKAVVVTNTDHTNYGDVSLPSGRESSWSRFVFSIQVTRPGIGIFVKLFAGLFIATAIALQALRIPAREIEARMGLVVGAMFAAVASEYLVAAGLPESNGLTMADEFHILSFAFIFIALAESILAYKLTTEGKEALAVRVDRIGFRVIALAYILLAAFIAVR
jgi:hypothetical protein